ncbi:MAG: glycosyltransferase family 4 protein [Melioribacteraceae bacterium]|nr:glycosyltransferase family 4 protein [Melioribacteraceae bacterium]
MNYKTAIVHEWFVNYMGSEKCVESFVNIFPESDIFSLVDFLETSHREKILKGKSVTTSFIQKLPFASKKHRQYLSLFPLAIEQLDVSQYDVVLSSSHAVAKGTLTNSNQLHICYCHTPIRYAWDLYHQYIKEAKLQKGVKGFIAQKILHKIRIWDLISTSRVDHFIANSNHVAKRIKKIYNRNADVIYPPVDTSKFGLAEQKENYYLTAARFVPYKKVDLIVEAFKGMQDKKLIVIGDGPELAKIKSIAGKNVELVGHQNDENFIKLMKNAKAFLFAAEEDFGITNVEAQACGTPVIAFGVGGARETVLHNKTGMLFEKQTPDSLKKTIEEFEKNLDMFSPSEIRKHALQFDRSIFERNISNFVKQKADDFYKNN